MTSKANNLRGVVFGVVCSVGRRMVCSWRGLTGTGWFSGACSDPCRAGASNIEKRTASEILLRSYGKWWVFRGR